jgi:hypothetical protein
VIGYARTEDYVAGGVAAAFGPGALYALEKFAPSHVGKGGFPKVMRLATVIGLTGGFLYFYQRSARTFSRIKKKKIPTPSEQDLSRQWHLLWTKY